MFSSFICVLFDCKCKHLKRLFENINNKQQHTETNNNIKQLTEQNITQTTETHDFQPTNLRERYTQHTHTTTTRRKTNNNRKQQKSPSQTLRDIYFSRRFVGRKSCIYVVFIFIFVFFLEFFLFFSVF